MKKILLVLVTAISMLSCKKDKQQLPPEPVENITGKLKTKESSESGSSYPILYKYSYNEKGKLLQTIALSMINGNNYYDTIGIEKYLYNGKEVIYTNTNGGSKYTYQLNDRWLVVSGSGNLSNKHQSFSFTYNADKQLTEYKTTEPRDNTTQTWYQNWYYTNGVCDSFARGTTWAGTTFRATWKYEYDLTGLSSIRQEEYPLSAEIFGKQPIKYLLNKSTLFYDGINSGNSWRYQYQYDAAGKITERKIWNVSNTTPDPEFTDTYTYN